MYDESLGNDKNVQTFSEKLTDRVNLENDAYIEREYFNEFQGNELKRYVEAPDSIRVKNFDISGVEHSAVLVMVLAKSLRIRYALHSNIRGYYDVWLRWSRGSVLAFSTQVRGFKTGRSRRIFKGQKILSTPSFGGEVKPSVPCRRFAACKRSLNGVEVVISAKLPDNILSHSSHFRRWDLSRRGGRGGTWW